MGRSGAFLGGMCCAAFVLSEAGAASATQPADAQAAGVHTHDGFYLRFATGFAAYNEEAGTVSGDDHQLRTRGFAVASEFAMGGTPVEGLVIGGGIYSVEVLTSTVSFEEGSELPEGLELESRDFNIIAVFVDRYFVPTLGVHLQAALGIGQQLGLSVSSISVDERSYQPYGPGLMLGLGYEMWIASQWSLGVLARLGTSLMFGKDQTGARWVHFVTTLPTFLMTVTYH